MNTTSSTLSLYIFFILHDNKVFHTYKTDYTLVAVQMLNTMQTTKAFNYHFHPYNEIIYFLLSLEPISDKAKVAAKLAERIQTKKKENKTSFSAEL